MKKQLKQMDEITKKTKETKLGPKIMYDLSKSKKESWIRDIDVKGNVIGRLEIFSGKYERFL